MSFETQANSASDAVINAELEPTIILPVFEEGEEIDGRYAMESVIDTRPHAVVVRAHDVQDMHTVGLKVYAEPDDDIKERTTRELETHRLMAGEPGIVPYYGMGLFEKDEGLYRYIATALAPAGDLHQYASRNSGHGESFLPIVADILPGLEALHKQGIVHRDVKPTNILVSTEISGWLTDFGIAERGFRSTPSAIIRDMGSTVISEVNTREGEYSGTPGFIPPETIESRSIGPATDVFGFGVTLFNATTGRLPWETSTFAEYVEAVTHESPTNPRTYERTLSNAMGKLITDCLRHDPEDRPTVPELGRELQTV